MKKRKIDPKGELNEMEEADGLIQNFLQEMASLPIGSQPPEKILEQANRLKEDLLSSGNSFVSSLN